MIYRRRLAQCVSAAVIFGGSAASARDADLGARATDGNADSNQKAVIEEIVVFAQKRNQNLQDVPIAISALSAEAMDQRGIAASADLPTVVPGINVGRQGASAVTFIRGVGTNNAIVGAEASVALYVDGVYSPFTATALTQFNNVERVEVLKGPQGTLFGRNATGGLIHVITKNPQSEPAASIEIGYGNYDTASASFYGSTGLGERLAADLAVHYSDQGKGFVENPFLGNDYRPERDLAFRTKWRWSISEETALTVSAFDGESEGSSGVARQPVPGALGLGAQPYSGDWYEMPSDQDAWWENESSGITATFEHEFRDVKLTSISGWRDDKQTFLYSVDSVVAPVQNIDTDIFSKALSQEIQLASNDPASSVTWIAGLYAYQNETGYHDFTLSFSSPASPFVIDDEQRTRSYAAFGELRWGFAPRTGLTVGVRYSRDEIEFSGNTFASAARISRAGAYSDKKTFEEPTWRAGVDHRFNDQIMGYATYSRGYKAGFYNVLNTSGVIDPPVGPEILDAYELGVKTDLLDQTLRVNAAVFYYDYQDIQVTALIPPVQRSVNAAESTIYGGELDIELRPMAQLTLGVGVSILDATFDSFENGIRFVANPTGGATVAPADLSDNEIPRSPKWTASAFGNYTIPTEIGPLQFNVTYFHNDGFYWEPENRLRQDAYDVVNAELSWTSLSRRYEVAIWSKNLFDEEYAIYGVSSTAGDLYSAAAPLTYGAEVSVRF